MYLQNNRTFSIAQRRNMKICRLALGKYDSLIFDENGDFLSVEEVQQAIKTLQHALDDVKGQLAIPLCEDESPTLSKDLMRGLMENEYHIEVSNSLDVGIFWDEEDIEEFNNSPSNNLESFIAREILPVFCSGIKKT